MRITIILAALFSYQLASAQNITLLSKKMQCLTKLNAIESERENVHSIQLLNTDNSQIDSVELTIKITFLKCSQINGQYQFQIKEDHMQGKYENLNSDGNISFVYRSDLKKDITFFNENYQDLKKIDLSQGAGVQIIKLKLNREDLNINRFPNAQERGTHYIEGAVKSQSKYFNEDFEIGPSYRLSGHWRIFLKL